MQTALINDTVARKRKRCAKKFLFYFPKGFTDKKYNDWERNYKWNAHLAWQEQLNKKSFATLIEQCQYELICQIAIRIESSTNLLFSFEKMALRDAVKTSAAARSFATGLYDYIYGNGKMKERFETFTKVLAALPRKQTRVLTWPLQTVFGFIADPAQQLFLKPRVTKAAADKYAVDLNYKSKPNWDTYQAALDFMKLLSADLQQWQPKDMIDLQSFVWVMGSEEYPD